MSGPNRSTQAHSIGQFGHKIADGTSLDCWLVRCPPSVLQWWGIHHQCCTGEVSTISAALVRCPPSVSSTAVVRCPPSVIHCGRVKYCTKWPITFGFPEKLTSAKQVFSCHKEAYLGWSSLASVYGGVVTNILCHYRSPQSSDTLLQGQHCQHAGQILL